MSDRMPAEWGPPAGTWMAFPTPNPTFGDAAGLAAARAAWAAAAPTLTTG
ncbi:MAG TPA: hypothetical protein VFR35_05375 [Actinoplanes sp.]|nr:hypothetical protein [Actinoplanes sp.]